jgi:uncharacterized protein YjbI with pentapeptide repeats
MDKSNFYKQRWQSTDGKELHRKIVDVLESGKDIKKIIGIKRINFQGVKCLDLRGLPLDSIDLHISELSRIDFSYSNFKNVRFLPESSHCIFTDLAFKSVYFERVEFNNIRCRNFYFNDANIKNSSFSSIIFLGRNFFLKSKFSNVSFSNNNFDDSNFFYFYKSDILNCKVDGIVAKTNTFEGCLFSSCDLRNVNFNKVNLIEVFFNECIADIKTSFDEKLIIDRPGLYSRALSTYMQIKKLLRQNGLVKESRNYYAKEMQARIKKDWDYLHFRQKNIIKKIYNWIKFKTLTPIYSQEPFKVFGFIFGIILICAVVYFIIGIEHEDRILKLAVNRSIIDNMNIFLHCLYFSVVTITTLGYGDYTPINFGGKIFASIESLSGPVLLSVFIVVLTKKLMQD